MKKVIKIWNKRLEISKEGKFYMLNNAKTSLFIHVDKLKFKQGWLTFWNNEVYIGSLWIKTSTDMKKIKKFLEETKHLNSRTNNI